MQDELKRAVDAIPGQVWSALPDGSVDFVNQRWCDYTGITLQEACVGAWRASVHPKDLPRLSASWQSLLESGQPGEFEARLRRFDGVFRWFLIRAVPLRNDRGDVVKWYGQNTDIEDRKQADALLAGEKRLLEMVAWGCALPVVLDSLCALVEETASGALCSVLLIDQNAATVQHGAAPSLPAAYNESIHGRPVNHDAGPCGMAAALKTQVVVADVSSDPRWDPGGWRALALSHGLRACWSTPILSLAGNVLGTFALYQREPGTPTPLHQDLIEQFTHIASIAIERAQNEAALKRSEAFLAEAQRLSLTGSFSWRVAKDEIVWSEQTYRIYGIDPRAPITFELVGTRLHPDEVSWFQALLGRARSEGADLEFEHRLRMPDQSIKHLHVVAHATRDRDGQLEYIGAVQDVTARRRAEEALGRVRSELARMARVTTLGALTASIAHQVKQPLSGIITNASTSLRMLGDEPPDLEGARETARRTIRDAHRAVDVIDRLHALFRNARGSYEPLDLNAATREVLQLLFAELRRAGAVVRTELSDDLPTVTGDRVQLQQVVLNLVMNAAEAMSGVEDRPRLMVIRTVREGADHVRLSVEDSGAGFDRASRQRLFDAFYTTKSDGMGMGLSVSRSIIEGHEGQLWAAGNDGPGATFGFSIPRAPSAARTVEIAETAVAAGQERGGGPTPRDGATQARRSS